ncbi:MAG TPA: hypothetical protein VGQ00_01860 [Candidatus Norongarragalinales archaeon]|nr:hypothetical protein [Candidatus Norongarragalinales archaeon]
MRNFAIAFVAASSFLLAGCVFPWQQNQVSQEVHEHADFLVLIDGYAFNFSQPKYMSDANHSLSPFLHLHDGDGTIIHKHFTGVNLNLFFKSIGMTFNSTCFITDEGRAYCNDGAKTLKFFVNGQPNSQFGNYEIHDLDRILISYGSENNAQIQQQLSQVTSNACIGSNKCSEKGVPGNESTCTTAGGCVA